MGTGFYAGVGDACATTGTYKWRVGTATDARVAWDGTSLIVRGTVQADQGWFKGCILGGAASQYAVGTGLYAGFGDACATSGTYKFRVGTTAQQRMLWDGSKLEVYDSNNFCVMRIGAADSFFLAKDSNGVTRVRFGSSEGDTPGMRIYDPSGNVVLGPEGNYNGIYLVPLSVNTPAINNLAVTNAKIADLAVTNAKIDNLAVTNAKIDNLAVTNAKIDNLAVTNAKIDNLAVTTFKVADNAITIPVAMSYTVSQGMTRSQASFTAPAAMRAVVVVSVKPLVSISGSTTPSSMSVAVSGATNASITIGPGQLVDGYYLPIVETFIVGLFAGPNYFSVGPTSILTRADTVVTITGMAK